MPSFGTGAHLPQAPHKRYVVFATMVTPLFAYDLCTERGVHPATLLGTCFVGALLVVEYLFGECVSVRAVRIGAIRDAAFARNGVLAVATRALRCG